MPDCERQSAGNLAAESGQSSRGSADPLPDRPSSRQAVVRHEVETGSYKPKDNKLQRHPADKITAARKITRLKMV